MKRNIMEKFDVSVVASILNKYKGKGIDKENLDTIYAKALLADSPKEMRTIDRAISLENVIAAASDVAIDYMLTPMEEMGHELADEIRNYVNPFCVAMYKA